MSGGEKRKPRTRRWLVRDTTTLAHVLGELGETNAAIVEGRVFIGRKRAGSSETIVPPGTWVEVSDRRGSEHEALVVLDHTPDWIAVAKPAGIPTIADQTGSVHSLHAKVAAHLGRDASLVHPTSRLDREVSGVVIFALTPRGRDVLAHAREEGTYRRRYVAIARAESALPESGEWNAPIGRGRTPLVRAVDGPDAAVARTAFVVLESQRPWIALALFPRTGRTHQLRVHAAHAGAPLLGDATYGGPKKLTTDRGGIVALDRILLHAHEVDVPGGARYVAKLPPIFAETWKRLGGADETWVDALACAWPVFRE